MKSNPFPPNTHYSFLGKEGKAAKGFPGVMAGRQGEGQRAQSYVSLWAELPGRPDMCLQRGTARSSVALMGHGPASACGEQATHYAGWALPGSREDKRGRQSRAQ